MANYFVVHLLDGPLLGFFSHLGRSRYWLRVSDSAVSQDIRHIGGNCQLDGGIVGELVVLGGLELFIGSFATNRSDEPAGAGGRQQPVWLRDINHHDSDFSNICFLVMRFRKPESEEGPRVDGCHQRRCKLFRLTRRRDPALSGGAHRFRVIFEQPSAQCSIIRDAQHR